MSIRHKSTRYPKLATIIDNMPEAPLGNVFENNVMIDCKKRIDFLDDAHKLLAMSNEKDNVVIRSNLIVENAVKNEASNLPPRTQGLQQ